MKKLTFAFFSLLPMSLFAQFEEAEDVVVNATSDSFHIVTIIMGAAFGLAVGGSLLTFALPDGVMKQKLSSWAIPTVMTLGVVFGVFYMYPSIPEKIENIASGGACKIMNFKKLCK